MEFNSHLLFAPQKGIFCFPGKVEVGIYLGILLPSLRKLEPFYHLTIFPSLLPLLVGKLLPSLSSGHQRMRGKAGCVCVGGSSRSFSHLPSSPQTCMTGPLTGPAPSHHTGFFVS